MITKYPKTVDIGPIVEQVNNIHFEKRIQLNETSGNILNGPYTVKQEYKGTPLGILLESLGNIGEARLLKLKSAESYTAHCDPDDRLHLAITTNPHCYLIDLDEQKLYHIPVDGQLWYMDTGHTHVAANYGGRDRIHLNIRVPLPAVTEPYHRLSIEPNDFDWKQEAYTVVMKFFNRAIKENIIQGFEKVNEREALINCDLEVLDPYVKELRSKGFRVFIS